MAKYRAIGFDLDGTLVNTNVNYADLHDVNRVLEPYGIPVDDIWADRSYASRQPLYEWLNNRGRHAEIPKFDKILDDRCLEIEMAGAVGADINYGIITTLKTLRKRGYKIGVATRGGHSYAIKVLSEFNLLEFIDVVQGRDDFPYSEAKPSPMAMVHLSRALEVELDEMLYVGDNLSDYESARDAGVDFAGVLTGGGNITMWTRSASGVKIISTAADVLSLL